MLWLVSKTPPYPPKRMGKSKEGEEVSYLVVKSLVGRCAGQAEYRTP